VPVDLTDEYRRERAVITLTQPVAESGAGGLAVHARLEAEDLAVMRDGLQVRDDRLRVFEAGLRATWRAGGRTRLSSAVALRLGLDALGAGLHADDLPADPRDLEFRVAHLQATGFTRFNHGWSLRTDVFAQYSGDVLPDGERFKIGGERLGRGFEVAEIAGDRGLGAKLLLRREIGEGGRLGRPSVYGLYDIGAAWKQDIAGRESAATAGIGLALNGTRWSGYLEAVRPVTRADIEGKRSTTLFAEVGCRF
jgi:hemolysin activation/secretion protein